MQTLPMISLFVCIFRFKISIATHTRLTGWGLPLSADLVYSNTATVAHFTATSFSISGWYYSCSSASYTVFCKMDSSGASNTQYICLEVESDSSFVITINLGNHKVLNSLENFEQIYVVKNFKAQSGWTWFGITVKEQFQNTILTFYASNDAYSGLVAATPFKSESVTLQGYYGIAGTIDPLSADNKLIFGCQTNTQGDCFKPLLGYFFEFKIWANQALTSTQMALEVSMTCTGSCKVCTKTDNKCQDQRNLLLLDLDFEQNSQTLTDTSTNVYSFTQGPTTAAELGDPIRILQQGYRFGLNTYIQSTNTPMIKLPQGFVVEAWIRFDLNNTSPTNSTQYIYYAKRATQIFSISVGNNFIRVQVNDAEVTFFQNWLTSSSWRFIAVSLQRTMLDKNSFSPAIIGTSQVKIWIDRNIVSTQTLNSFFEDDQTAVVQDKIGLNFEGVIRKFRIYASTYCNLNTSPNVATTCSSLGATSSCTQCDKSTSQCFSSCGFNTLDNLCTPCNWKCLYCSGTAANCIACDSKKNLIGSAPTCSCSAGYVEINSNCMPCHSNCATCLDTSNSNCPVCSSSSFLYASKVCLQSCPYGYMNEKTYHLCHFNTDTLSKPVQQLIYMNQGCNSNQYATAGVCSSCDPSCATCAGGSSSDCTSCVLGKYLHNGQCLTCDPAGMIIGSSGACVEKCGDGKNFGLVQCDDGNTQSGDGCSNFCEIEDDWTCSGGSSTSSDKCYVTPLTIEQISITSNNNVVLHFSKPAYIISKLTKDDLEISIQKYDGSYVQDFDADFQVIQEMPTRSLFIQLQIGEFLQGLAMRSKITVTYKRSGKIFDTRLNEMSTYTQAFSYIEKNFPDMSLDEINAINGMGVLNNIFIIFTIGFTSFLSLKYEVSTQPAYLLFFGLQEILYTLLLTYEFPFNMKFFWKNFNWVQLEFTNLLPNTFQEYLMDMNQIEISNYAENYQFLGFNADSIIINSHLKIFIWFGYTLSFLFTVCLAHKLCPKKKESLMQRYLFSSTISLFMCCLMPLGHSSFIEIQFIKRTLPYKLASVSTSFFILTTIFFFLYSITLISFKAKEHYHNDSFLRKYLSLLKPFKIKTICLLYYPLYSWKRFVQIIVTELFIDMPMIQTLFIAAVQGAFLAYVLSFRPFTSTYNNLLSIISQLFPLSLTLYSWSFTLAENDPSQAFRFGWGAILLLSIYCLLHTLISILANINHILDKQAFIQKYRQQLEDKIKLTILRLFYRKGAAEELKQKKSKESSKSLHAYLNIPLQEQVRQPEDLFIMERQPDPEPPKKNTTVQDENASSSSILLSRHFNLPPGINKTLELPLSGRNPKNILPPINDHRNKVDARMIITASDNQSMPKGSDSSQHDQQFRFGMDMTQTQSMSGTKKKKKVKKKIKKKKNALGETVREDNDGYLLI